MSVLCNCSMSTFVCEIVLQVQFTWTAMVKLVALNWSCSFGAIKCTVLKRSDTSSDVKSWKRGTKRTLDTNTSYDTNHQYIVHGKQPS